MRAVRIIMMTLIAAMSALAITACGGGGGGSGSGGGDTGTGDTSVTGLSIASRVSIVDATATIDTAAAPSRAASRAITQTDISGWASTVDYHQDETEVWVNERVGEYFEITNEILCMLKQTKYTAKVNAGVYVAQIDANLCSSEKKSGGSGGEGEATEVEAPEYEFWTVDSTRASETAPQIVTFWIDEEERDEGDWYEPAKQIQAKVTITEPKSATRPLGVFEMDFIGYIVNGDVVTDQIMFRGHMEVGADNALKFVMEDEFPDWNPDLNGGMGGMDNALHLVQTVLNKDGDNGTGWVQMRVAYEQGDIATAWDDTQSMDVAFSADYFLRSDGTDAACYDRSNPKLNAWRYGVYDNTGARVDLDSGFPFVYDNGTELLRGWAGYWGIHFDQYDANIPNGATIAEWDYNTNDVTGATYTVKTAPGKMQNVIKGEKQLGQLAGVYMQYHQQMVDDCDTPGDPSDDVYYNPIVKWNGTAFDIVGKDGEVCGNPGMWERVMYDPDNVTDTIDLSNLEWPGIGFWSEALGGSIQIEMMDPTDGTTACVEVDNDNDASWFNYGVDKYDCTAAIDNTTTGKYYKNETVEFGSGTGTLDLYCFDNCPDPQALANLTQGDDPWSATFPAVEGDAQDLYHYVFDYDTMTLKYDNQTSGFEEEVVLPASYEGYGMQTSALFPGTEATLKTEAVCDWFESSWESSPDYATWFPNGKPLCGWDLERSAPEHYRWETGNDPWNQLIALEDDANPGTNMEFDRPVQIEYTDADGNFFLLNYEGFGDLWGIPYHCEDGETGEYVPCPEGGDDGDGRWVRWVADFVIPIGAQATYTDKLGATQEVVIKPLEVEEQMGIAAGGTNECASNGVVTEAYNGTPPVVNDILDPAIGAKPAGAIIEVLNGEVIVE